MWEFYKVSSRFAFEKLLGSKEDTTGHLPQHKQKFHEQIFVVSGCPLGIVMFVGGNGDWKWSGKSVWYCVF